MKTLLTRGILLTALFTAVPAFADGPGTNQWLEEENIVAKDGITPALNGFATRMFPILHEKLGLFSSFLVIGSYGEAYAGPLYAPTSWLQLGVGFGVETDPGIWRLGSVLSMSSSRGSFTTFAEYSRSGFWYRAEATLALSSWLGVGAMGQTSAGVGPRVEFDIPRTPAQVWIAPAYDFEDSRPTFLFGFRLNP